ncbi:MAG: hypothetical protein M0035_01240 [Actinomycetota bacterium]|jgi:hypothetical protein|nr:hypothetical protein [Actinomycetota bacterium]
MTMPTTMMPTTTMQDAHDEAVSEGAPRLLDKPRRRSFTAEYKLRILAEDDACAGDGDKGALCAGRASTRAISSSGAGLGTQRRQRASGVSDARRRTPMPSSRWRRR